MSSVDLSAALRQGAFYSTAHPVLSGKAFVNMLRSISSVGHARVNAAIESHPDFTRAQRAGVEFTGLDKRNAKITAREEQYISRFMRNVPGIKQSEGAFTGFLDTQRMQVFSKLAEGVTDPKALKALGRMINIGTGRADVGPRLTKAFYVANTMFYSPRLTVSRLQLLNKMFNPVGMKNMPAQVRGRLIADNVKFMAGTAAVIGLAVAAGARVSTNPDDADFFKVRFGNSHYDLLAGLQQPMRAMYRFGRAVIADTRGDETFEGEPAGKVAGRFVCQKLSPEASFAYDYLSGTDYNNVKFKMTNAIAQRIVPLVAHDFYTAMKNEGLIGAAKASPGVLGVGFQDYADVADKPVSKAEKLARKFVRLRTPEVAKTQEEIDMDQEKATKRRQDREAAGTTRFQEDFKRLRLEDAEKVYSVATQPEQSSVYDLLINKREREGVPKEERKQSGVVLPLRPRAARRAK
jgi:hypothetical protein